MDVIELLSRDHRMVERLFRDDHAAASGPQRRVVVEMRDLVQGRVRT